MEKKDQPPLQPPPPRQPPVKFYGKGYQHNPQLWENTIQSVMRQYKVTRAEAEKMLDEAV